MVIDEGLLSEAGASDVGRDWLSMGVHPRRGRRRRMVGEWALLRLLGHLAAGDQHRHYHRYFSDGLLDPEYAESRSQGNAAEARRADSGRRRRAHAAGGPGETQRR